jgi:hypothetical protein
MPSSKLAALAFVAVVTIAPRAVAQQAEGYLVERFYPSAPGAGWFVMDALDTRGTFGGAVSLTTGYAYNPLRVGTGASEIRVVSDDAFAGVGMAATYDRFRFYINIVKPLVIDGQSGTFGGYTYTGPAVDLGTHPDTLSDTGFGFDARIYGDPRGPLRRAGLRTERPTQRLRHGWPGARDVAVPRRRGRALVHVRRPRRRAHPSA